MSKSCLLMFCIAAFYIVEAQENTKGWLALETDPITTALGANTISLLIEPHSIEHWSLFLNIVRADFSEEVENSFNPNNKEKGFESSIEIGGGFGVDYFYRGERTGLYWGIINLFFNNRVQHEEVATNIISHNIITRMGYRWYPFERLNLYVNPFAGARYEYSFQKEPIVNNIKYESAAWQPFGTLHIGYHF